MTAPSDLSNSPEPNSAEPNSIDPLRFNGNFTQQEPIPDDAIKAAVTVLQHGRLHRYNVADNEPSETAQLETEFAASIGSAYSLACASGGYALHIALRA